MKCEPIREQFSAFLDNELDHEHRQVIEAHLSGCAGCQEELAVWRSAVTGLHDLGNVPAPEDLLEGVRAAIHAQPWWRRLADAVIQPWQIKLPLEAIAVVATVLLVVNVSQRTLREENLMKDELGRPVVARRSSADLNRDQEWAHAQAPAEMPAKDHREMGDAAHARLRQNTAGLRERKNDKQAEHLGMSKSAEYGYETDSTENAAVAQGRLLHHETGLPVEGELEWVDDQGVLKDMATAPQDVAPVDKLNLPASNAAPATGAGGALLSPSPTTASGRFAVVDGPLPTAPPAVSGNDQSEVVLRSTSKGISEEVAAADELIKPASTFALKKAAEVDEAFEFSHEERVDSDSFQMAGAVAPAPMHADYQTVTGNKAAPEQLMAVVGGETSSPAPAAPRARDQLDSVHLVWEVPDLETAALRLKLGPEHIDMRARPHPDGTWIIMVPPEQYEALLTWLSGPGSVEVIRTPLPEECITLPSGKLLQPIRVQLTTPQAP